MEEFIDEKNYFSKKDTSKTLIKIEYKDKDGHYSINKKEESIIKRNKEKQIKELNINDTIIKIEDLEFKEFQKVVMSKFMLKMLKNILII